MEALQLRTCTLWMHEKFCGRGMGPSTRLENHGCEATWVWHYGSRKCRGMCHVAHVDVGTRGTTFKATEARTCGLSRHRVSTLRMQNNAVADARVRTIGYRGMVLKYHEPLMSSCTRGCRYMQEQK